MFLKEVERIWGFPSILLLKKVERISEVPRAFFKEFERISEDPSAFFRMWKNFEVLLFLKEVERISGVSTDSF